MQIMTLRKSDYNSVTDLIIALLIKMIHYSFHQINVHVCHKQVHSWKMGDWLAFSKIYWHDIKMIACMIALKITFP